MKAVLAGLLALFLSLPVFSQPVFKQEQTNPTILNVPFRGGLLLLDQKRIVGETQYLKFDVKFNDYFSKWPNDHLFVLSDAFLNFEPNPGVPYSGRGLIIDSKGVYLEDFSNSSLYSFVPIKFDFSRTYTVIVHANATHVAGFVYENYFHPIFNTVIQVPVAYNVAYIPDPTPKAKVSLMIVGALTDFSPQSKRVSSNLEISNIEHGRFLH